MATSTAGPSPLMHVQSNDKIEIFDKSVIVASTGAIGLSQRLNHHISQAIAGNVFRNFSVQDCTTNVSKRFLTDLTNSLYQMHPQHGVSFGSVMAACLKGVPYLIEFGSTNFQPEIRHGKMFFVSMGSGQLHADPFLAFIARVLWHGVPPTVKDGKLGVYWTLSHTITVAPGGVGKPIRMATLTQKDGKWVAEESQDMDAHETYTADLENYIGKYAREGHAVSDPIPPAPI